MGRCVVGRLEAERFEIVTRTRITLELIKSADIPIILFYASFPSVEAKLSSPKLLCRFGNVVIELNQVQLQQETHQIVIKTNNLS